MSGGRVLVIAVPLREVDQTLQRLVWLRGWSGPGLRLLVLLDHRRRDVVVRRDRQPAHDDMTVALSESDVSKVKVGQPATATLDALTGVRLGAHVTAISTVGTTSGSVVSYNTTLTLDHANSQVKSGMSASASIMSPRRRASPSPPRR